MSESLLLHSRGGSGGGGGGGGWFIGLFISAELWSTELSLLSVVLVVDSSSTSSLSVSTSSVDVPLKLFVRSSECSVLSKAVFGTGVLLHVSEKVSGYFDWRVPLEV